MCQCFSLTQPVTKEKKGEILKIYIWDRNWRKHTSENACVRSDCPNCGEKGGRKKNKPPDLFRFLEFIPRFSALFLPLFLFLVSFHSCCSEGRRTSVRIMKKTTRVCCGFLPALRVIVLHPARRAAPVWSTCLIYPCVCEGDRTVVRKTRKTNQVYLPFSNDLFFFSSIATPATISALRFDIVAEFTAASVRTAASCQSFKKENQKGKKKKFGSGGSYCTHGSTGRSDWSCLMRTKSVQELSRLNITPIKLLYKWCCVSIDISSISVDFLWSCNWLSRTILSRKISRISSLFFILYCE